VAGDGPRTARSCLRGPWPDLVASRAFPGVSSGGRTVASIRRDDRFAPLRAGSLLGYGVPPGQRPLPRFLTRDRWPPSPGSRSTGAARSSMSPWVGTCGPLTLLAAPPEWGGHGAVVGRFPNLLALTGTGRRPGRIGPPGFIESLSSLRARTGHPLIAPELSSTPACSAASWCRQSGVAIGGSPACR